MKIDILSFDKFPPLLKEIPDSPEKLYCLGNKIPENNVLLTVVGSRKYTEYGKRATESIISGLKGFNLSIVSGLALGIDAVAHRSALKNNMHTIAVPGSGLDKDHIYPRSHRGLYDEILKKSGTFISEFEPRAKVFPSNFPKRNRIMAGMSHATLVIEAAERSGTLITARLALEYNRDVFAVPGSIFSSVSFGTNKLIQDGASPVQSADDIIEELHLEKRDGEADIQIGKDSESEDVPFFEESISRDIFIKAVGDSKRAQILLSKLELQGKIVVKGDTVYKK